MVSPNIRPSAQNWQWLAVERQTAARAEIESTPPETSTSARGPTLKRCKPHLFARTRRLALELRTRRLVRPRADDRSSATDAFRLDVGPVASLLKRKLNGVRLIARVVAAFQFPAAMAVVVVHAVQVPTRWTRFATRTGVRQRLVCEVALDLELAGVCGTCGRIDAQNNNSNHQDQTE